MLAKGGVQSSFKAIRRSGLRFWAAWSGGGVGSPDDKTQIVEETFALGAKMTEVARRNGVAAISCSSIVGSLGRSFEVLEDASNSRALDAPTWIVVTCQRRAAPQIHKNSLF